MGDEDARAVMPNFVGVRMGYGLAIASLTLGLLLSVLSVGGSGHNSIHISLNRTRTLLVYYTGMMDGRLDMTIASAFLLLNRVKFECFRTTLRFFFFGEARKAVDDQLMMLRGVDSNVDIKVDIMDSPLDLADRAGMRYSNFTTHESAYNVPMVIVRLFVPIVYPADWYMYIDSDVEVSESFSSRLGDWLRDQESREKVIMGVKDEGVVRGWMEDYVREHGMAHPEEYIGSGVLFLRGGEVLNEAMRSAVRWVADHPRRLLFPDQDGINFGVDRWLIRVLPDFLVTLEGLGAVEGRYFRHYAGWPKAKCFRRWRAPYDAALAQFRRRRIV